MNLVQIILIANAFVLGIVVTLALRYLLAHRRGKTQTKTSSSPLSPATREKISKTAEQNFQGIVNRSALQLQHDLGLTSTQLNKLLEKFGTEVLDDEMKLFRENVAAVRGNTQSVLTEAEAEIAKQQAGIIRSLASRQAELDKQLSDNQAALDAQLQATLQAQTDALTNRLNEKMNDAVLAFIVESLGHEADLGAQTDYLLATLEENKKTLIEGVRREA